MLETMLETELPTLDRMLQHRDCGYELATTLRVHEDGILIVAVWRDRLSDANTPNSLREASRIVETIASAASRADLCL